MKSCHSTLTTFNRLSSWGFIKFFFNWFFSIQPLSSHSNQQNSERKSIGKEYFPNGGKKKPYSIAEDNFQSIFNALKITGFKLGHINSCAWWDILPTHTALLSSMPLLQSLSDANIYLCTTRMNSREGAVLDIFFSFKTTPY